MDNENETRPLLHSFQNETWRGRARKKCMRIPSEITITGIILGLFLIVVTLLIVLENMESDKKEKNTSVNTHLLASPMKFNKKVEDLTWQDKKDYMSFKNKQMEEKSKKWDKVNKGWKLLPGFTASLMKYNKKADDLPWADKTDYMKFKEKQMEEKSKKWDKVNKGWKQLPDISASPMKFNKKANQSWDDFKDYKKMKEKKMEDKSRKWDKINKKWKKLPDISDKVSLIEIGNIHDNDYEEDQNYLDDEVETMIIGDKLDEYGKEIDDSLETFANLRMSSPSEMRKFKQQVLEVKNLLHSNINWGMIDDGWKALSEQGWRERDIRRALFMALNEKRQELKKAQLENILQSPMNMEDIWDQLNNNWKKNLYEGNEDINYDKIKGTNDQAEKHLNINEEWRKKDSIFQSPTSNGKKFEKEDKGWKNKDNKGKMNKEWKNRDNVMQSPLNIEDLWVKATDFLRNIFIKGKNIPKSQMDMNNEWASKFNNLLESSYKKKNNDEKKNKHSKDVWKDKTTDKPEEEPTELKMNFDDFSNIIQALKDHDKGMDYKNSQMEINDEVVNLLQSSYKKKKKNKNTKNKHPKDATTEATTEENENEDDQLQQSPVNIEDFVEVIEAIREKGKKEAEKQKDINDDIKNEMGKLYSSKPADKRWKQIDDHFKTLIEYERNSFFGRNDGGDVTPSPGNISLQKSMPFIHSKQDKMGKVPEESISEKDIKEAVYKTWKDGDKLRKSAFGHDSMKWKKVNDGWKKVNDEWKTISNKSIISSRCPFFNYQQRLLVGSSPSSYPIDCALVAEKVKKDFGYCIDLSLLPKECKIHWKEENCYTTSKYRKMDGTCNNKAHPTWGQSGTPFVRMMEPDYADGVSALRAAKDGGALPNPRLLSSKLYSKRTKPNSDTTVLFMYFGLIVDHDMIETAVTPGEIPCCDFDFKFHPLDLPKECLQIDISKDDPFYGPRGVICLNLVRSAPVNGECGGRREQLNKATAFLDGSVVYGSTPAQAEQLRTFNEGQLRTQLINNTPFMAYADEVGPICGTPTEPLKCFEAGDSRVNMMVELAAMHTLWYREHNRIASALHKLNPDLRDEILYQEARRILIAELQHITYNEFLPLLLGKKAVEEYDLKIEKNRTYHRYDETVNPSVFNVFGAAAFRFGHSLVPDVQYLLGPKNTSVGKVPLHETFFNVRILHHDGFDLLLRGAATQRTQTVDSYVSPEVREHLFQPSDLDYGYDLAAVGIQRGRDHGLPGYIKWRSVCGLPEVKTWDDMYKVMDKDRVDMLKEIYKAVEDIDLIPGALAEPHEEESLVGPTYTCLLGRQFEKTRKGDRFWFENRNEIGSLTKDQLEEIYKSSMARIVCDNSDGITEIQKDPFKIPSDQNAYISCDTIPKVDLSKWSSMV